jgi:hypothetical protein
MSPEPGITSREVRQTLQCKSPDNRASVFQVAVQCRCCALSLCFIERQPRHHKRQVPSKFDLLSFGEQAQQFGFILLQQVRSNHRDLFRRVCRPHPHDRIFVPQTFDELRKAPRLLQNESCSFV